MFNKLFVAFSLTFSLMASAANETPQWTMIFDGEGEVSNIYIDKASITVEGHSVTFNSRTQLPASDRIDSFTNGVTEENTKFEPSSLVVRRLTIDCDAQTVVPHQTDFYNDVLKLTFTYKAVEKEIYNIEPNYDTAYMYESLCGRPLTPKSST